MDKFDEEKLVIEYFRKCYPEFPKGKLIKSESPDFILKVNPKSSFGIELTRLDQTKGLFLDQIRQALNKKQQKIYLYQKGWFQQLWLIIHADQIQQASNSNLNNSLEKSDFYYDFDQVFLFDLFNGQVYPLSSPEKT